jgi:hypothetical protein
MDMAIPTMVTHRIIPIHTVTTRTIRLRVITTLLWSTLHRTIPLDLLMYRRTILRRTTLACRSRRFLRRDRVPTQSMAALRPEVANVIRALRAMPPNARQQQIDSGRYDNLSPREMQVVRTAVNLPPS